MGADNGGLTPLRTMWPRALGSGLATVALLAFLFMGAADYQQLELTVRGMQLGWLLPAVVALAVGNLVLSAVRWRIILGAMNYRVSVSQALTAVLATWPFVIIVPSRASDFLRAFLIRRTVPVASGTASVLVEKLIDVHSLCLMTIIGALATGLWVVGAVSMSVIAGIWTTFWLGSVSYRRFQVGAWSHVFAKFIAQFLAAVSAFPRNVGGATAAVGTSILAWVNSLAIAYCWFLMTGADVTHPEVALLWPVAVVVGALPLTIAGMGTRDLTFLYLLDLTRESGASPEPVLVATMGYTLMTTWLFAVVGLPFAFASFRGVFRSGPSHAEDTAR